MMAKWSMWPSLATWRRARTTETRDWTVFRTWHWKSWLPTNRQRRGRNMKWGNMHTSTLNGWVLAVNRVFFYSLTLLPFQYINALKDELATIGSRKKFKIVHWLISSRNVGAFMIKSEFFSAISIIIAPKKEHWYAAYANEDGRSKYGTRDRTPGTSDGPIPTYIRCRDDYCANNCSLCQAAKNCICFLHKRSSAIPTIEEDLGDLV